VLAAEMIFAVGAWQAGGIDMASRIAPTPEGVSNIEAIGTLLYTRYLYIFETAGLVLLVALIGAIVLTHRVRGGVKTQSISAQNMRRPEDATRNVKPEIGKGVEL
jgi:NADH-quinone oxidoreductase subunit J